MLFLEYRWHWKWKSLSRVQLLTPWILACQAPLSMEFSRQEYWSGVPSRILEFPSPADLPNSGIKPRSPTLQVILYHLSHQGSPRICLSKQETQETWAWSLDQEDPLEQEMATPLQYSCLENSTGKGPWQAVSCVHGNAESDMTEWLGSYLYLWDKLLNTLLCI